MFRLVYCSILNCYRVVAVALIHSNSCNCCKENRVLTVFHVLTQEVEPSVGEALCRLFPEDETVDFDAFHRSSDRRRRKDKDIARLGHTSYPAGGLVITAVSKGPLLTTSNRKLLKESFFDDLQESQWMRHHLVCHCREKVFCSFAFNGAMSSHFHVFCCAL